MRCQYSSDCSRGCYLWNVTCTAARFVAFDLPLRRVPDEESIMQHVRTKKRRGQFDLLASSRLAQAAMMSLRAGQESGDRPSNEHPRSEQWLYVIAGTGRAIVGAARGKRRSVRLAPGSLVLIKRGEAHQIKLAATGSLRTINFYVPPAYTADGQVRTRAKR
jgi:oxalate decarboxylase/phosphoglucose isomerase-like protein (cupin superfamily)